MAGFVWEHTGARRGGAAAWNGAPLAASVSKGAGPADPWVGPQVKVPVTAVLRFDDPRRGMSEGALHGTIQLFDADRTATVQVGDVTVPLESERTAALAYQLEGSPLWDFEIAGFRPGDFSLVAREDNLFMLNPYRPGRIPNVRGQIARRLVSLPATLTKLSVEVVKLNPAGAARTAVTMPTAIDDMDGSQPFIKTLSSLPIASGVKARSIVAVQGDGPPEEGDDGVVKYTSAHIDGVESELIVRSGHSTQGTPQTIEGVRRILYEHLEKR